MLRPAKKNSLACPDKRSGGRLRCATSTLVSEVVSGFLDARLLQALTSAEGRELAVALFESCRWTGDLLGAGASDWFRRRSILILTPANGR